MTPSQDPIAYQRNRRKTVHPFNVELTPKLREQLDALSANRYISSGAVLRQLIAAAYTMHFARIPTCANGQHCLVPQVHPANQPTNTQPAQEPQS